MRPPLAVIRTPRYTEVTHRVSELLQPKEILVVLKAEIQAGMKELEGVLN